MGVFKNIALTIFFGLVAALFLMMAGFPRRFDLHPVRLAFAALGLVFATAAISIWFVKKPKKKSLASVRVPDSRPPTYRLKPLGGKETWFLVLAKSKVTLLHPDQAVAVSFGRQWAGLAIRTPGFINGTHLQIVRKWKPPTDEPGLPFLELWRDGKRLLFDGWPHEQWHAFEGHEALTEEIQRYCRQGWRMLGPEAAPAFRRLARRQLATGLLPLAIGIVMLIAAFIVGGASRDEDIRDGAEAALHGGTILGCLGLVRVAMSLRNTLRARNLERRTADE